MKPTDALTTTLNRAIADFQAEFDRRFNANPRINPLYPKELYAAACHASNTLKKLEAQQLAEWQEGVIR